MLRRTRFVAGVPFLPLVLGAAIGHDVGTREATPFDQEHPRLMHAHLPHHKSCTRRIGQLAIVLTLWPAVATAAPTNILFIFTDDHAQRAISAYGGGLNQTPHLDRLAKEGMLFRHCLVTNSICGPSRACIQTGKYSHKNGFYQNGDRFDGSQQTFPKLLRQAGYQTAVIGKWHLESDPTGFDYWQILPGQGAYYNPLMFEMGTRKTHQGYTTDLITDLALDWLTKGRDPNKPFLLMCQHKAPHREWAPGPAHLNDFKDAVIPEPPTLFDDYSGRASPARNQDMSIEKTMQDSDLKFKGPGNLTPEQQAAWDAAYGAENAAYLKAPPTGRDLVRWRYQRYLKDYLRCVASVDDSVGRLLKYLDDSGLAANTLVMYSSDQGFYLGEHGWFDKRWIYEESLHTPLLVRWPGVARAGSESRELVSNLDFAETFLDAAGVAIPSDMQGRSLRPVLAGQTPADWRKSHYYHYYEFPGVHDVARHYGIRTDRYKLVFFYQLNEWELFDLEKDPQELKSVYGDPAYAPVLAEMKSELDRVRAALDDGEDKSPAKQPAPRKRPAKPAA